MTNKQAVILAAWITFFAAGTASAGDLGRQWAQANGLSNTEKQWFRDQLVPGGAARGASCCSDADGTYAEEEIRNGRYWTRFQYKKWDATISNYVDVSSDWMEVPPEVVLSTNHHGAPVVWWWIPGGKLVIRCYAPGSGA
jgi:hypothetical protein